MEKRVICGMIVLLLISVFWLASSVQPAKGAALVIYIRADGSVDPPTAPVKRNGDYYNLTNNIYDVNVVIQKDNIVFDGYDYVNGYDYILQGTGAGSGGSGFSLTSRSNVTIRNVELKAFYYCIYLSGSSKNIIYRNRMTGSNYGIYFSASANNNTVFLNEMASSYAGLWISSSHRNNLSRNYLHDNSGSGITLSPSNNNTISENTIVHNPVGIGLTSSTNNTISGNNITNQTDDGISLAQSPYNIVTGNKITRNSDTGIYLYNSDFNDIRGNIVTNNQYGIRLQGFANSNTIFGNQVSNTTSYGVYLYGSGGTVSSNSIEANNITYNNRGLVTDHANYNTIVENTFTRNAAYGMYLYYSSNNHICHNNLLNNTAHVYVYSSVNFNWDDGYPSGGNYWSGYKGVDSKSGSHQDQIGSDGINDTQYVVDANNQDRYPLMNPWPSHDIAVAHLSFTKSIIEGGSSIVINVTVADHGDFAEEINLTVYFNTVLVGNNRTIFSRRGLTTRTFVYNTTGIVEGIYNVTAHVEPVALETDLADNTFTAIPGDVNFDRIVNVVDGATISSHWTGPPIGPSGYDLNYDIDNDGTIGILDASMISAYWTGPPKGPLAS